MAGLACAQPSIAPPRVLRLGLVGCSWFALRAHIPAILRLEGRARSACLPIKLTAVCSRTKKSMAKAEAKVHAHGTAEREVRRHAKLEAMFSDPEIDCVLLVLPIPLMPSAIEAALRAGKHVLSEKPAAPGMDAALRLLDVLRELGPSAPLWLVMENWALKPSVLWMRERLQEGAIGRCISAHVAHHHPTGKDERGDDWRGADGDGWLADVGVHWVRALRCLLGEPTRCSAHLTSTPPDASAPAAAPAAAPRAASVQGWVQLQHCASAATLSLSYGGPALPDGSCGQTPPPPSLRIQGEKGVLCWWATVPPTAGGGGGGAARGCRVALETARATSTSSSSSARGSRPLATTPLECTSQTFEDDDWVDGGVGPTLEHALRLVCDRVREDRYGEAPDADARASRCLVGCDEALRDLALACALRRSHEEGRALDPGAVFLPALRLPPARQRDASGTWHFTPAISMPCSTVADVRRALRHAAAEGLHARAIGRLHSWSRHGSADGGACLLISPMDRVLAVDAPQLRVSVEPGLTLRELRRVIAVHGMTLPSWPMLLDQTVGGATVGAGSHGSSPVEGTMSDLVTSLSMVAKSGDRLTQLRQEGERQTDDSGGGGSSPAAELSLHEARLSVGRHGVAVAITLRCVPSYYVRRHVHRLSPEGLVERSEALCEAYRHLWVWWAVGQRELIAVGLEDVGTVPALGASRYDGENWYRGAPSLEAPGAEREAPRSASGRWYSMQYAFPRPELAELVRALDGPPFAGGDESIQGRVLELKFVGGPGHAKLGVNADGPVVCVNLLWLMDGGSRALDVLTILEESLVERGGRPHLGKWHSQPPDKRG